MKKVFSLLMATILLIISGCQKYDDSSLRNEVNDLKNRIVALEMWATTVNSNITALQGIVAALQNNDYVTGITSFTSPEPGGYIIAFTKSGNVTIFNGHDGQNGKDGANGKDGIDGQNAESPQISVQQDTDGVYYWTLNGEWLTVDGNKLRVTGENGTDGKNPQIRVNSNTNIWEVSYDSGATWSSLGVAATGANGTNGADGQNGITPQLRINASNVWEVSYDNGASWTSLGVVAKGNDGTNGADGQNGNTPQLRVNSSNVWEVSYDGGTTWNSLGVQATGADGTNGTNGIAPIMRINSSNIWEVSYDEGVTWTSLEVEATGDNGADGQDGQDGVTPQIRINTVTNEWEISYDNGDSWTTTGIKATGEKGDQGDKGDAVFASNGVNNSNTNYVEFTLADGTTKIKVPKYKALGLDFTQPAAFTAGETKNISYTPAGNVVIIKFVDIPNGWKVTVNTSAKKFTVIAPATFNNSNKGGEATILVSDDIQHTIIRTINFTANTDGGSDSGDDDDDDDDNGGGDDGGGDDGGDVGADATTIAIDGYSGNTMTVYYVDNTQRSLTKNIDGVFAVPKNNKVIHNITLEGGTTIIIGRKADGSTIQLRLINGNLTLRDVVNEYIPIGTYSEFQLVQGSNMYKQEADIDLLDLEWIPIKKLYGTFDGDNHTLANLKITGNNDNVGLFSAIEGIGSIQNVHVISGSVSGNSYVGGICGTNSYSSSASVSEDIHSFNNCSNAASVSGNNYIGGVCGYVSIYIVSYSGNIVRRSSTIACRNAGSVLGTNFVGGVYGFVLAQSGQRAFSSIAISSCSNTGSVSGNEYVGGICGRTISDPYLGSGSSSSSISITACYNIGSVSANSYGGGICGYIDSELDYANSPSSTLSITACYNIGSVSANSYGGGICGRDANSATTITACYWKDVSDDNVDYGIGSSASNTGITIFSLSAWPTTSTNAAWGTGDGSNGGYWKSLGGWNGGNPIYPKLYFED
jgi:hypothetical protein